MTAADAVTEPYGVAVQEVSDLTLADVTLNMDTTSAVGGYADGVFGSSSTQVGVGGTGGVVGVTGTGMDGVEARIGDMPLLRASTTRFEGWRWVLKDVQDRFLALVALFCLPRVRTALLPRTTRRALAHRSAMEQFLLRGVGRTRGRTGVLIFVSLAERYARIVADEAIAARVPQAEWQGPVDVLVDHMRQGRIADGFVEAIDRCGVVLSNHFPAAADRANQLPYRMMVPRRVDNLLVAGRCASMTRMGQSSARVTGPCFAMGQAAGTAADLALSAGTPLRRVETAFTPSTWRAFCGLVLEAGRAEDVAAQLGLSVNAVLIAKSRVLSRLRQETRDLVG